MRSIPAIFILALMTCAGCGSQHKSGNASFPTEGKPSLEQAQSGSAPPAPGDGAAQNKEPAQPNADPKAKEKPRKIRYNAEMKLVVESIDDAEEKLDAIRKEHNAEYEKAEVNRSVNAVKSGMWKIRVPVNEQFTFRKAVAKIGQVERDTIESEDITAKYYDLDAHITNRKLHREQVRKFFSSMNRDDNRYLQVMRELEDINDYINRSEGQLKLWAQMTDMSTYTIFMREKQSWEPPVVVDTENPDFQVRASSTWEKSWERFVHFWQNVAIVGIAVAPWLPIVLAVLVAFVLLMRRRKRAPATVTAEVIDEKESK